MSTQAEAGIGADAHHVFVSGSVQDLASVERGGRQRHFPKPPNHSKTAQGENIPGFRDFIVKIVPKLTSGGYLSTETHLRVKNGLLSFGNLLEDFSRLFQF